MSPVFSEQNQILQQVSCILQLHSPTDPITNDEIKELFRILRVAYPKEFRQAQYVYDPMMKSGTILGQQNHRQLVVASGNFQYIERKNFHSHVINSITEKLYDFYLTKKNVNLHDMKLIGKVFDYWFTFERDGLEFLREHTYLFADKDMSSLNIRASFVERSANIHLNLNASIASSEDDDDVQSKRLFVRLDVNNRDQVTGFQDSTFSELLKMADNYSHKQLIDVLNNQFGE